MQNNPNPQDFSLRQAMQMAQTPAGQQLVALLRSSGGKEFQDAMAKAAAGDYTQARELINAMLNNPEAQKLIKELER